MKKRKSPALTSPWKIGLLVSLLIIVTGAGVNYLLMRTHEISWNWISLEPGNYAFHLEPFFNQMYMQLVLVFSICVIAYFLVTAAVRAYRSYLDSGQDYKRLLKTIKGVDNLENKEALKPLESFPEIKQFLDNVKNSIDERDSLIKQQQQELDGHGGDEETQIQLQDDCNKLITAIREKIAQGERRDLDLKMNNSLMTEVAAALLEIPVRRERVCGDEETARMKELHQDLRQASDFIRSRLQEISNDLVSNSQEAKNIESQVTDLQAIVDSADGADRGGETLRTIKSISDGVATVAQVSEGLGELGEETKSIAINAALQAGSGQGTLSDLIELAESVKEIAKKYDQSATICRQLIDELAGHVSTLQNQINNGSGSPETVITSNVNTLSSKMSLWVERSIVLSDKIKTLEKSYGLSFQTIEDRISGYADITAAAAPFAEFERSESVSFPEDIAAAPGSAVDEPEAPVDAVTDEDELDTVNVESNESVFHFKPSPNDAPVAEDDGSGFEGIVKEEGLFNATQDFDEDDFADKSIEIQDQFDKIELKKTNAAATAPEASDDQQCAVDDAWAGPDADEDVTEPDEAVKEPADHAAAETPDLVAAEPVDTVDLESMDWADDDPADQIDAGPAAAREATGKDEEEIFDLYELGAVDYVAHHSD